MKTFYVRNLVNEVKSVRPLSVLTTKDATHSITLKIPRGVVDGDEEEDSPILCFLGLIEFLPSSLSGAAARIVLKSIGERSQRVVGC